MSINIEDLPYRPCAGIMLVNKDGKVFVGSRVDMPSDAWQMPQGGIDEGEQPEQAALRELYEETGVPADKARVVAKSADWIPYDLPADMIPRLWGGRYRGQTQMWFLIEFLGTDDDIDLDVHHREFGEWQWADPEQLPDLIVKFKSDLYRRILAEFRPWLAELGKS
ncbi:MAG: RNA pyrophosphohydrolase [Alphaproteobacteria bacterium]|jgi:putative (di)nucleoside polyphosphate hydrolase|nr:RNA pyrophosphohydrolase [Alphaproteobacteria bacterium]MBT4082889.1 RNA pyrophosphohydrolase [Alphaproteobacteria bacterium]MBT4544410.1 RNA pyrophosphohydrolase [Alphaproteobacteria bacterium]MBT5918160.1 RNA pyrophosphohydrolase [Alphaproteobacteria bacterium]MBT6386904.1 RNA pyrophosphohydrolase [Alphaproteobacteria bacterium]